MKMVNTKKVIKSSYQNLHFMNNSKKQLKPSDIISLFGKIKFFKDYDYKKERNRKK
jgi:hypothetical protein